MAAYYNEIDPFAAQWLRELIKKGHIADGEVDERSIVDVRPDELRGFSQCHFFAGIGVWSHALRQAGWGDDQPVWTGSCPCQPFSSAGKGDGFADERHLWPHFHWLIQQCQPPVVFGEQVASKDGLAWLDLVQADLEGTGYASGALDLCAAGVGAPHIRQRLWWVAERLADADEQRRDWLDASVRDGQDCHAQTIWGGEARIRKPGSVGGVRGLPGSPLRLGDDDARIGRGQGPADAAGMRGRNRAERSPGRPSVDSSVGDVERPGPTNGHWRDADWLFCRDGKWRPVESGTFPLVDGATARVVRSGDSGQTIDAYSGEARAMRLRGYGNALNAEAVITFIESYKEARNGVL